MEKTFISLFGGIGGFDLALTRHGWKNVWYNDHDKYAVQTYNKNFGTKWEPKDIRKVDTQEIPEHSLLCAGFPCQDLSNANTKGLGLKGKKSSLFFEICRVVQHKKPQHILLENVEGLISKRKDFITVLSKIDELGYNAQWQIINSQFWTNQHRKRVYIFCTSKKMQQPQIFPIIKGFARHHQKSEETIKKAMACITTRGYTRLSPDIGYVLEKCKEGFKIRGYTPEEAECWQGFSIGWTVGSNAQRYRQLGNAVTVNVIEAIVKGLRI